MEFFYAAGLAVCLSVPLGPIGFTAGEQMMRGNPRAFMLIGLGCVVADMLLTLLALAIIQMAPQFDPVQVYRIWWLWLAVGLGMAATGVYLWRNLSEVRVKPFLRPFSFGLMTTLIWPSSWGGVLGAFLAAHVAGWLPKDAGRQLLLAPSMGLGTAFTWLVWAAGCYALSRQTRWGLPELAHLFQRFMAGSVVLGGFALCLKPLGY